MNNNTKIFIACLLLLTLSSCEAYSEFEKNRFKYIILPVFFGTLIIGILGYIFRKKE
jgi:hypothetical protein